MTESELDKAFQNFHTRIQSDICTGYDTLGNIAYLNTIDGPALKTMCSVLGYACTPAVCSMSAENILAFVLTGGFYRAPKLEVLSAAQHSRFKLGIHECSLFIENIMREYPIIAELASELSEYTVTDNYEKSADLDTILYHIDELTNGSLIIPRNLFFDKVHYFRCISDYTALMERPPYVCNIINAPYKNKNSSVADMTFFAGMLPLHPQWYINSRLSSNWDIILNTLTSGVRVLYDTQVSKVPASALTVTDAGYETGSFCHALSVLKKSTDLQVELTEDGIISVNYVPTTIAQKLCSRNLNIATTIGIGIPLNYIPRNMQASLRDLTSILWRPIVTLNGTIEYVFVMKDHLQSLLMGTHNLSVVKNGSSCKSYALRELFNQFGLLKALTYIAHEGSRTSNVTDADTFISCALGLLEHSVYPVEGLRLVYDFCMENKMPLQDKRILLISMILSMCAPKPGTKEYLSDINGTYASELLPTVDKNYAAAKIIRLEEIYSSIITDNNLNWSTPLSFETPNIFDEARKQCSDDMVHYVLVPIRALMLWVSSQSLRYINLCAINTAQTEYVNTELDYRLHTQVERLTELLICMTVLTYCTTATNAALAEDKGIMTVTDGISFIDRIIAKRVGELF